MRDFRDLNYWIVLAERFPGEHGASQKRTRCEWASIPDLFVLEHDPVLKRLSFCGQHINRTARIEPVTVPGCVFASEQFAALLSIASGDRFSLRSGRNRAACQEYALQALYGLVRSAIRRGQIPHENLHKNRRRGRYRAVCRSAVPKDDPRIEAYGTVDELNAVLGLARTEAPPDEIDSLLVNIQHTLFDLGAELATPDPKSHGTNLVTLRD